MSSPTLEEVLGEALDDEYKARATYREVIRTFGAVRPFTNIVEAEGRHVRALLPLFERYGIPVPADRWEGRVQAPPSLAEAARTGVRAEIDNAAMYDRLLAASRDHPDVQRVLTNLQRASQLNHLPAFRRAVERLAPGAAAAGTGGGAGMKYPTGEAGRSGPGGGGRRGGGAGPTAGGHGGRGRGCGSFGGHGHGRGRR
jgi:hypothetical protein